MSKNMEEIILQELNEIIEAHRPVRERLVPQIKQIVRIIISAFLEGSKVVLLGNGGSAADAQHIASGLTGRFMKERKPLPAIALSELI